MYLCFHTGTPSISSYSKANTVLPLNSLHYWSVQQIYQLCSEILVNLLPQSFCHWWLGKATEKHTLIYWQGKEQFKMLSSYGTFPVPRFEGIPAFCPFFQMTVKIPDPEFCGISAYFTNSLHKSFNDSIIYAFNSCTLSLFCRSLALGAFMMSLNS